MTVSGLADLGRQGLRCDVTDGVALLTLNRPDELNAIDGPLHEALEHVWRFLDADEGVRAAVLTGAGRAFSAGANLDGFQRLIDDRAHRRSMLDAGLRLVEAMAGFAKPIVAAVNGPAVGLGVSMVGFCDIVLMAPDAYLADTHVSVGLVAGDGTAATWPLLSSLLRVKEAILLGERIPAARAVEWGLATRVCAAETLLTEATGLAARLAAQPAQAVQDTKRALNRHIQRSVREVLPFALATESSSFDTQDVSRILAGLQRRKDAARESDAPV